MGEKLSDTLENFTKIQWEDLAKYARQQVLLIDKIKTLEAEVATLKELGKQKDEWIEVNRNTALINIKRADDAEIQLAKAQDSLIMLRDKKISSGTWFEVELPKLLKTLGVSGRVDGS